MKAQIVMLVLLIDMLSTGASAQKPIQLQYRPQSQLSDVFTQEDLKKIYEQEGALPGINTHLGNIDDTMKNIKSTLDNDVLPTIHIMKFLEWFFAIVVGWVIVFWLNEQIKNRQHSPKTTG